MIDTQTAYARRWAALALLAVTQFVVVLDITIVNIALPTIQTSLGFSPENLQWVVDAYLLAFGGFLVLGGRAADLFGRRTVFMTGLVVFGVASFACGLADNATALIVARAVQGLGGAILSPAALSLVILTFTDNRERTRAMGIWSAVAGAGGATGVVLGGVLTDGPGWSWVFWVNVPFVLACAALAPTVLPGGRPQRAEGKFDLAGALSVTLGLAALIYGLVEIAEAGVGSPRVFVPLVAAVVLLGAFIAIERRVVDPIVPFRIFRAAGPRSANIVMLAFAASVVAMNFFMTLYLQQILHFDATRAGLAFLPMAIGQIVFSNVASKVIGKLGVLNTMLIGLAASAVSFFWFAMISPDGTYLVDLLGPVVLLSIGGGFTIVGLFVTATSGIEMRDTGISGGLINMSQQVGGAIGLAGLSTLAVWRSQQLVGDGVAAESALTSGFRLGFLIAGVLVVAAAIAAWLMLRQPATQPGDAAAATDPAPVDPTPGALEPSPTQAT